MEIEQMVQTPFSIQSHLMVVVKVVVIKEFQVVMVDQHNNQHLIQVPLNMEMMVEALELTLVVAVVPEMLDNHIPQGQIKQDGVAKEYKRHQHLEILQQDMVEEFLEEIHLVKTGDSLVAAAVVVMIILLDLLVELMVQAEIQVDHSMVEELVH